MKQLIITADDFGKNSSVNKAIENAVKNGILTNTSLMMNGNAVEEAVEIAKRLPTLQVGMHLVLSEGKALSPEVKSHWLVSSDRTFIGDLAKSGFMIYFSKKLQYQIRQEIIAQLDAFLATGLTLKHVDCHHHFQIHPTIFSILLEEAKKRGVETIRIPVENWNISKTVSSGHAIRNFFYRKVFGILGKTARNTALEMNLKFVEGVFGLYKTGEIDEQWILSLLDIIPDGTFELYTHPDIIENSPCYQEYLGLISPNVKEKIDKLKIKLIHYYDI